MSTTAFAANLTPRCISLRDVASRAPEWLWPRWIPAGKLTVLDGDPDAGKSLFLIDLAARVSTTGVMPDGSAGMEGNVILVTDDSIADVVRPRLEAAGANLDRVTVLRTVHAVDREEPFVLPRDLAALRELVVARQARLLILDPFVAFLAGDVTQTLRRLAQLAVDTGCAVVMARHLAKGKSKQPLYRGAGPLAIIAAARAALLLTRHPEDAERRVLAPYKNTLGKLAKGWTFTLEAPSRAGNQADQKPSRDELSRAGHQADQKPLTDVRGSASCEAVAVVWGEAVPLTASQLLAPREAPDPVELDEAKQLLNAMLDQGPVKVEEARREAVDLGIGGWALRKAKEMLSLQSLRRGFGTMGIWYWERPAEPGVRRQESGVRGQKSDVRSQDSALRTLARGVARLASMQKIGEK